MTKEEYHAYLLRQITIRDRTLHVDLVPHYEHGIDYIQIGLEHVRASDDVRISYDFDRDGYKIEQSRITDDDLALDDWREIAFIPAWGLDERAEASV